MYSDEVLQTMVPKMSIKYIVEDGIASYGDFDNIPENATGACIGTTFPIVGPKGNFMFTSESYNLYVGDIIDISGYSEINVPKEKIQKFQKAGIKQVVSTKLGIVSLSSGDAVFSTQEEMAQAIAKINETFKSVSFSVQNSETLRNNL